MQAISDKSAEQEQAVLGQIETLAEATQQLNEATDKMVENQKEAFEMSNIKRPGGIWGMGLGGGIPSEIAKQYMIVSDTMNKGEAARDSGLSLNFVFKNSNIDPKDQAAVKKEAAKFVKEADDTRKALSRDKGGMKDYLGTASANSILP